MHSYLFIYVSIHLSRSMSNMDCPSWICHGFTSFNHGEDGYDPHPYDHGYKILGSCLLFKKALNTFRRQVTRLRNCQKKLGQRPLGLGVWADWEQDTRTHTQALLAQHGEARWASFSSVSVPRWLWLFASMWIQWFLVRDSVRSTPISKLGGKALFTVHGYLGLFSQGMGDLHDDRGMLSKGPWFLTP